jgi:hypothetical protein
MAITDEERREVARWAADSAGRVLPLFEAVAPADPRPREAIEIARAFANGERRTRRLFRVALAAHRAGREVGDPVGMAAARAASLAAANANLHGEATIGTLGHILGAAAHAALARDLASGGDAVAADEEVRWAIEHASPAIRHLVRRVPASASGRRRLDEIQHRLDVALRGAQPGSARAEKLASNLDDAAAAAIAVLERIPPEHWAWVPAPGVWSPGKDAEHVVDGNVLHQWVVRLTIGQAKASGRPSIERRQLTSTRSPAEVIELVRGTLGEAATLIRGLTDEQLDLVTKPPKAGEPPLATTIERLMIGHVEQHHREIDAKLAQH